MKTKLLVGNICTDANEEIVRNLFARTAGVVGSIAIPRDPKTGKNRGYALVEMNNDTDAQQAMRDLNGLDVEGRSMAVTLVAPSPVARKWYKFGAR